MANSITPSTISSPIGGRPRKTRKKYSEVTVFTEAQKKEFGITRDLTDAEWAAIEAEEIASEPDYFGDFENRVFGTQENPRSWRD